MKDKEKARSERIKKLVYDAMEKGTYIESIRKIEGILDNNPNNKDSYTLAKLGMLYDHAPRQVADKHKKASYVAKAIELYQAALKLDKENRDAIWGLGRIWWHKKSPRALPYARKAYDISKRKTGRKDWGLNVAVVYASLGKYKDAERWLLKTMPPRGNRIGWYAELAGLWMDKDPKRAERYRISLVRSFGQQTRGFKNSLIGKHVKEMLDK